MPSRTLLRSALPLAVAALALAGCSQSQVGKPEAYAPLSAKMLAEMAAKGMSASSPILVRVYKQESELEVWKQTTGGQYALLKTYPVCRWSGQLGPKKTEGDRQVPEGFYSVTSGQMNPSSKYYLSYNVGFPNAFDRSLGRSGGDIMVHGVCSSRGCFAMTNAEMGEIYSITRESLKGGSGSFQFQSYPFHMTADNMARNRKNPNYAFWQNLKQGSDNFEVTRRPVQVGVCSGKYVFNGQGGQTCGQHPTDASVAQAVAARQAQDDARVASLVASGTPAVAYVYEDGGENEVFKARLAGGGNIPGVDVPYNPVHTPTVVALNDSGRPASSADEQAASEATYQAAETLLMSEAAVARRPAGPQAPSAISKRQDLVYARLLGVKPAPRVQVASAAPVVTGSVGRPVMAPGAVVAPGAPVLASGDQDGFFGPMMKVITGGSPDPVPAAAGTTLVSTGPGDAAATTTVVKSGEGGSQPFYARWFGLGSDGDAGPADVGVPQAIGPTTVAVPLPPHDPRGSRSAQITTPGALPKEFAEGLPVGPRDFNAFADPN